MFAPHRKGRITAAIVVTCPHNGHSKCDSAKYDKVWAKWLAYPATASQLSDNEGSRDA